MKMHRRTTKRGKYSNWNSKEGKAKIKQSVQKWFAEFNGTMSLIDYAKKEGIPVTTLRQYCHNDVTKRKSVDDIKERKLIKAHERDRFIKLVGNKSTSSALRIIQEHYKLTHSQATQQYYRYAREAREEQPGQQSRRAGEKPTPPPPPPNHSSPYQVLVYQIPKPSKWHSHPFRTSKGCTNPEVACDHTETQYQVAICGSGDLLQILRNLHYTPHGTINMSDKNSCALKMKATGVNVIDIGEKDMCTQFDDIYVYRNGSSEILRLKMDDTVKSKLLHHVLDTSFQNLRSKSTRDVGDNVVRFDIGYTQGFEWSKVYVDAENNILLDMTKSPPKPFRIPGVLKATTVLNSMSIYLKKAIATILLHSQQIVKDRFANAFSDNWRSNLVHDNLWQKSFQEVDAPREINWEYVGIIARKVIATDLLAMHLDEKNDRRAGYEYCVTYSYVYHGYRMTIVMASKQDWGSLMERVAKVKVPGGKFI